MIKTRQPAVVSRTYRASVEELWALWTTKDGFESWWGPQGFRADVHELDACEGGVLRYDMAADTPEMVKVMADMGRPASHPATARFSELKPYSRLVVSSVIDFLPGVPAYESTIAVDFEPMGDQARMTVTMSPMHDEAFSQMSQEGLASQLAKLDARFGSSAPRSGAAPEAMRRLEPLVGHWRLTGRTQGATADNIQGTTTTRWILDGHFLELSGEMTFNGQTFPSLEIIGYDPRTDTFPATVFNPGGPPLTYHWDMRGDEVSHWTDGSRYTGRLADGGRTLAGSWRTTSSEPKAADANYDAVMTRVD